MKEVGRVTLTTHLIFTSPSAMQTVGTFEALSLVVGWSSSNVRVVPVKFMLLEFVGLAHFRFCQDFNRTIRPSKNCFTPLQLPSLSTISKTTSALCAIPRRAQGTRSNVSASKTRLIALLTFPGQAYPKGRPQEDPRVPLSRGRTRG
jgi:hypothetical protein